MRVRRAMRAAYSASARPGERARQRSAARKQPHGERRADERAQRRFVAMSVRGGGRGKARGAAWVAAWGAVAVLTWGEVASARLLEQSEDVSYEWMARPWSSGGKKTAAVIYATNNLPTGVQVTIERATCCLELDAYTMVPSSCDGGVDVNAPTQIKNVGSGEIVVWQFIVRSQVPFTDTTFCDFTARTSMGAAKVLTVKMDDVNDMLLQLPDDLLPSPPPPSQQPPSHPPPPPQTPCSNPDEALNSQGICTGSDLHCSRLHGQTKVSPSYARARVPHIDEHRPRCQLCCTRGDARY